MPAKSQVKRFMKGVKANLTPAARAGQLQAEPGFLGHKSNILHLAPDAKAHSAPN